MSEEEQLKERIKALEREESQTKQHKASKLDLKELEHRLEIIEGNYKYLMQETKNNEDDINSLITSIKQLGETSKGCDTCEYQEHGYMRDFPSGSPCIGCKNESNWKPKTDSTPPKCEDFGHVFVKNKCTYCGLFLHEFTETYEKEILALEDKLRKQNAEFLDDLRDMLTNILKGMWGGSQEVSDYIIKWEARAK